MLKKYVLLSAIVLIFGTVCRAQSAAVPSSGDRPSGLVSKSKPALLPKVKWVDSTTINDEKFGRITINMNEFKVEALKKAKLLTDNIGTIANSATSNDNANIMIDQTLALFVNNNATVEISHGGITNKKNPPVKIKIRPYLNGLKLHTRFDKIQVTYTNIDFVPEFKKGPDGSYYSVVTFEQKFEAFNDSKKVYGDITRKDVIVVLKTYAKMGSDGVSKTNWRVFLSDIGVTETTVLPVTAPPQKTH